MSANDVQVGGDHYKVSGGQEQHWDRAHRLGLTWFEGNATKYAERCRLKGSMRKDLEKAIHYLNKELELLDQGLCLPLNTNDPDYPKAIAPATTRRRR
jgi:hypothetical protein